MPLLLRNWYLQHTRRRRQLWNFLEAPFNEVIYVLGGSSIWTCRISNICYCILQAGGVEKSKQKFEIRILTCPNRWATKDIKIRCKSHFYFFWCVGNINSVIIGASHCSQHLYQIPYSSPDFHRNIERNNWKNEIITFYIFTQIRTGVTNLMKCWLLWDVPIITELIFATHQLKKTIMKLSWDFLQRGKRPSLYYLGVGGWSRKWQFSLILCSENVLT